MSRNTTDRPRDTFLTLYSAEQRGKRFTEYIENNFSSDKGEFADLQAVEHRLIDGPYIHHFVEMEGDFRREIEEFCKYFHNLKVDKTVK